MLAQNAFSPLSLFYKTKKSNQEELPDHTHDWYELIYIHEGDSTFFIDQNFYKLKSGDIILVPPNTIHRAIIDDYKYMITSVLYFSTESVEHHHFNPKDTFLKLYTQSLKKKEYRYRMDLNPLLEFESYLEKMNTENHLIKSDRYEFLTLHLHTLLLMLNRHCFHAQTRQSGQEQEWVRSLLTYIEDNLCQQLNLEEMAQHANVSPTYLSRIFKQTIGITLGEYITTKRMKRAKDMLCQSDDKIETIAKKCGYNSMPHFYRTFRKHVQATPHQYRRRMGQ
ncbi:helix-turn-helix transcriptional regulator [Salicibibacter cibi]|uniref:Helix-turn-helix transcriptional regulator n=1 Tax=Salicibibacter cibi TaxID=2743001 RepID=A0A7T6Z8Q1_9BACI|nr:AraC family transcriptional regulator [Salicibibacter cibi]QQK78891.1 helix-turn-helix transcriptional regulator [Salicibibacter cibi]